LTTLRRYWSRVDLLVYIPVGHASTTLNDTATDITTALAQVRASIAATRKQKGYKTPEISKTALLHNTRTAKALLDKFYALAQTRLLGIIAHRQQKIEELTTGSTNTPSLGRGNSQPRSELLGTHRHSQPGNPPPLSRDR
jgi:hypothetical protein